MMVVHLGSGGVGVINGLFFLFLAAKAIVSSTTVLVTGFKSGSPLLQILFAVDLCGFPLTSSIKVKTSRQNSLCSLKKTSCVLVN